MLTDLQRHRRGARDPAAVSAYNTAQRAYQRALHGKPVKTHGYYAYATLGCRCNTCKAAKHDVQRRYRARKKAQA